MSERLPESDDAFEVMGVARDVSELELKKRYFQLLRQFPPESHPDDFNRLQHAYEALKDPEARARLSQGEPYEDVAEPYRTRLREVLTQLKDGQVELAQAALKTMVQEDGTLTDARHLLQQVFFNQEDYAGAEEQLSALRRLKPDNTWFLYRHVVALGHLKRHSEASQACNEWITLTDGKEAAAWESLAWSLDAQSRRPEAFQCIETGLGRAEQRASLIATRMNLRLLGEMADAVRLELVEADLSDLMGALAPDDEEQRKILAERLQSLTANYFNRNHSDCANRILQVSRELSGNADSPTLRFPPELELYLEELPKDSQQWLIDEAKEPHIFRVLRRGRVSDVLLALLATVLWAGETFAFLNARVDTTAAWIGLFVISALTTWPLVWAWREVSWSFGVPHQRMLSIHPLYLLEVGLERLKAYPVVNVGDINLTHHHTNGVYTQTIVQALFGKKRVNLSIRGQALAQEFAQALQGNRYRALQLLSGGLLEAEAGFDFVPLGNLQHTFASPLKKRKRLRALGRWGIAVAVAAALSTLGAALTWERQRDEAWKVALDGSPGRAPDAEPPDARARQAAERLRQKSLQAALDILQKSSKGAVRASGEALLAALGERHLSSIKFEGSLAPLSNAPEFEAELATAFKRLSPRLAEGFTRAQHEVARKACGVSHLDGLTVNVTLKPRLTGRFAMVGASRVPLLAMGLEATLEGKPLARAEVALADHDLVSFRTEESPKAVVAAQLEVLLTRSGAALAEQLGMSASLVPVGEP